MESYRWRSRRRYSVAGSYWEAPGAGSAGSAGGCFWSPLVELRGLLSMFPQLRQILGLGAAASAGAAHAHQRREAPNEPMTTKRAAEILGITEDASPVEIRTAHRKLMGKMHPDKDGTDFLAALITEARDYLIARHQKK